MRLFRTAGRALAPLAAAASLATPSAALAEPWRMIPDQAAVTFSLDHAGFSLIEGRFHDFDALIDFDPEAEQSSSVSFTIRAASIDTDWELRDDFIRSDDMLDVEAFPLITFVSSGVRMISDTQAVVSGHVTIKGVTREESFDVALTGMGAAAEGGDAVAGFAVTGRIDRADYGVSAFAPAVANTMALRVELAATPAG